MPVMFWSQVVNGIVLPVVLVFMLILVNDRSQMGDHVNGRFYNAVCIAVILLIAAVSLAMPVSMLLEWPAWNNGVRFRYMHTRAFTTAVGG